MGFRRLVGQNRDQRPVASVEMDRFEQTHSASLVNDGFDGLNHGRRIRHADFGTSAERPGEDYRISEPLRPDHFEESEGMSGEGLDATDGR